MIGETVPDPDLELRSVVRSTQDPENEVGVSDIITAGQRNGVLCLSLLELVKCTWEVSNYKANSDERIFVTG